MSSIAPRLMLATVGDALGALVAVVEGELLVIEPQAMQDGGVQVVHMHAVADDIVAVVVRLPVTHAALHPAAGQPHGEAAAVVIAAHADQALGLLDSGAARVAEPDGQGGWLVRQAGERVAFSEKIERLKRGDELVLKEIKKVLADELAQEQHIDRTVRTKLASYSRGLVEGSAEWDVLYRKTFEEETRKQVKR